jgi:xanthine dehydrogenase YagR molybdenum-binding subunit
MPEPIPQNAPPKTKKVKSTITVNGQEKEVEIEVPDVQATWGTAADRRAVGSRMTRVDGWDKVSGRARYTHDINLPGMLTGRIVRSPHALARITRIDLSAAQAEPGVKAAILIKKDGQMVRYAGDEVAAIAATTPEIADHAMRLVKVEYEVLPFVTKEEDAQKPDAPRAVGNDRPNVEPGRANTRGDVAAAFASADATIENEYRAQQRIHACLETHGHVVAFQPDGLKVWASTQAVHATADEFAGITGIAKPKIEVVTDHMGGGFGSKFGPGIEGKTAAELAKAAGAPVKLMLDRRGESEAAGNAPSAKAKVKMAGTKDGKIAAVESSGYVCAGLGGAGIPHPYIYDVGASSVKMDSVRINSAPSNAMRAPGHPQASFLMEGAVDELAYKLGIDPLKFRVQNDPSAVRRAEYEIGAKQIGWATHFNKTPGKGNNGHMMTGVGVASATWGGGGGGGTQVEVRIAQDGSVVVATGTQDLGTGTRTYLPAIIADEFMLPREAVRSEIGNSKLGYSGGSGGSTTTPSVAPAVKMAAIQAKFDFLKALAAATGEPMEKLTLQPGGSVSNGAKTLTWKEACKRLPLGGTTSHGQWVPDLRQSGIGGVQFARVEVDRETGRVRVRHIVAVHDCGVIMNRLAVESQVNGGIIQGLGMALTEDRVLDRHTGRMLNYQLDEYKLPGPWEMPLIEPIMYEPPDAKGVSGIAEACVIPTASAIANAVYNACGARVRELPLVPARVLAALGRVPGNQSLKGGTEA